MKIDHIGIATSQLSQAMAVWQDILGPIVAATEDIPEQGVRTAMLPLGEAEVELLEPLGEDSPVGRFIEKRGAGVHHIAIRVDDIYVEIARLKEKGVRLVDESPRLGARGCLVAFVHPSSTGGVLLELVEHR